jgi:hypothetical protein
MTVAIAALLTSLLAINPASAQVTFGALSNFDVFNDTGGECHGFEIELDGVSAADVTYTFGAPYERYGNPALVDFAGGVYVRYQSQYDAVAKKFLLGPDAGGRIHGQNMGWAESSAGKSGGDRDLLDDDRTPNPIAACIARVRYGDEQEHGRAGQDEN